MRAHALSSVELRAAKDTLAPSEIVGYAARFETLSEDLGGFREKIAKGAFSDSLSRNQTMALWQHRHDQPLGSTARGTLKLVEDDQGLAVEITPPNTSWGRDALVSIERGDVQHFSFGFYTERDSWDFTDKNMPVRTLESVRLLEVSPVTFPAYPATSAAVREMLAKTSKIEIAADESAGALSTVALALERERVELRLRLMGIEFP